MVTCPRCMHSYDETKRANCPLCFTAAPRASETRASEEPFSDYVTPPAASPELAAGPVESSLVLESVPGSHPALGASATGEPAPPASVPAEYSTTPEAPAALSLAAQPAPEVSPVEVAAEPSLGAPRHPAQSPTPASLYPPQAAQPGSRTVRVSLTGEIIEQEAPAPVSQQPSSGTGGPPATGPRSGAPALATQRGGAVQRRPAAGLESARGPAENMRPKMRIGEVVFGVLFAAVLVGGVYYWFSHRSDPKEQARLYLTAVLKHDWKTVFALTAMSEEDSKKLSNADAYAADAQAKIDANPMLKAAMDQLAAGASSVTVGDATIKDDKADVPTSFKMSAGGANLSFKGVAHMINQGGWKFDGKTDKIAAMRDLIGQPTMGGN